MGAAPIAEPAKCRAGVGKRRTQRRFDPVGRHMVELFGEQFDTVPHRPEHRAFRERHEALDQPRHDEFEGQSARRAGLVSAVPAGKSGEDRTGLRAAVSGSRRAGRAAARRSVIATSVCSAVRSASPMRAVCPEQLGEPFGAVARGEQPADRNVSNRRAVVRRRDKPVRRIALVREIGCGGRLRPGAEAAGGETTSPGGSRPRRGSHAAETRPICPAAVA